MLLSQTLRLSVLPYPRLRQAAGILLAGNEGEKELFDKLDKLLGAGRLAFRYLIGRIEHSSVSCKQPPVGVGR